MKNITDPKISLGGESTKDSRYRLSIQTFILENLTYFPATVRMLERITRFNALEIKPELHKLIKLAQIVSIGIRQCMETGHKAHYYTASPHLIRLVNEHPWEAAADGLTYEWFVRTQKPDMFHWQETRCKGGLNKR